MGLRGRSASTEANPTYTFTEHGQYNVQLTVTDATGKTGVGNVTVTVGNTAPTVSVAAPVNGGFFDFGDHVAFEVDVSDPEDGEIDCGEVVVQPALGHDAHAHPMDPINACEGVIETIVDDGHAGANIFYSIDASYTDHGGTDAPRLIGRDTVILQPKHKQAEYFTSSEGIRIVHAEGAENGKRIGDIDDGDWIAFTPVNFAGIDEVSLRVSAPEGAGGSVELRAGAVDGQVVATVEVPSTGGWDNYEDLPPVPVTDPGETTELFVVFRGEIASPFDLDSLTFLGDGVAQVDDEAPEISVTGVADGASYGDSTDLILGWEATDSGSGIASVEAELGGKPIENGAEIPLYTVDLGEQEFVIGHRQGEHGRAESHLHRGDVAHRSSGLVARFAGGHQWEDGHPADGPVLLVEGVNGSSSLQHGAGARRFRHGETDLGYRRRMCWSGRPIADRQLADVTDR